MKILRIRGANLASLAGPFEIDLEHGPLGRVGLFAITGPVGAGKSTLIDAMCLALFDCTPRLADRSGVVVGAIGAVDGIKSSDVRSLLRRGAGEGHAEVEFIGRDRARWRARWSVRRARSSPSGRLQAQTMTLTEVATGRVVGDKRTETLAAIEERLGLNFEQFCRSVVLAQGDFALFLRARAADRAALLERMTATEIYGELSRAAHTRASEATQRIKALEQQLATRPPLDEAVRRDLEARRDARVAELESIRRLLELSTQRDSLRDQTVRARARLLELATAASSAETANEQAVAAAATTRQAAEAIEREWRELGPQLEIARRLDDAIDAAQRAETEESARLERLDHELVRATNALTSADPTLIVAAETWIDFVRELGRHARQRELVAQLEVRHGDLLTRSAKAIDERSHATHAMTQHEREAATFADLPDAQHSSDELDVANTQLAAVQRQREAVRQIAEAAALERDITRAEQARSAADEAGAIAQERLREADRELRRLDGELATARTEQRLRDERASLAEHRARLVPGQPCSLCGATEHPFCDDVPTTRSAAATAVDELSSRRDQIVAARARHDAEARTAARRATESADQAAGLRVRLEASAVAVAGALSVVGEGVAPAGLEATLAWAEREAGALERRLVAMRAELDVVRERQRILAERRRRQSVVQRSLEESRSKADAAARAVADLELELAGVRADLTARTAEVVESRTTLEDMLARRSDALDGARAALATRRAELAGLLAQRGACLGGRSLADLQRAHSDRSEAARAANERCAEALDGARLAVARAKAEHKAHDKLLQETLDRLVRCETRLTDELAGRDADDPVHEVVADGSGALTDLVRHLTAQLREVEIELGVDERNRAARDELQASIDATRRDTHARRQLGELIGSADGSKFRRFAQDMSFLHLLAHANRHLRDLTPRYRLVRVDGAHLEVQILDLEMGDELRSVQSLSGGETFLVSLAMALGLASMAARQVRLETLFIDEGLGTLDAASLEAVLAALDALQATGYQVGVVSHIEGLAERVSVRIEVAKLGGGRSEVVVRSDAGPSPRLGSDVDDRHADPTDRSRVVRLPTLDEHRSSGRPDSHGATTE